MAAVADSATEMPAAGTEEGAGIFFAPGCPATAAGVVDATIASTTTTTSSSSLQPLATATLLGRERDGREARSCQDADVVKGAKGGAKEVRERKSKQRSVLISTVIPTKFSDGSELLEESSTFPSEVARRCRARKLTPFRWADPQDGEEEREKDLEGRGFEEALSNKGEEDSETDLEIQHSLLLQKPVPTSDAYAALSGTPSEALRGYTLQRVKSKDDEFFRPLDTIETDCSKVSLVLDAMEHSLTLERCCV